MNMLNKLQQLLISLAQKQTQDKPELELQKAIQEILASNGYGSDEDVQSWLIELLDAILNKKIMSPTRFDFEEPNKGDFVNLLAEFNDLIPFDYENYGEAIQMSFDTGIKCTISFEGDTFEVSKMK